VVQTGNSKGSTNGNNFGEH
jgi:hypothetical protein